MDFEIPDFSEPMDDDGPKPMVAKYDGWCHVCREDIHGGFEEIAYDRDEGRWGHKVCVE